MVISRKRDWQHAARLRRMTRETDASTASVTCQNGGLSVLSVEVLLPKLPSMARLAPPPAPVVLCTATPAEARFMGVAPPVFVSKPIAMGAEPANQGGLGLKPGWAH